MSTILFQCGCMIEIFVTPGLLEQRLVHPLIQLPHREAQLQQYADPCITLSTLKHEECPILRTRDTIFNCLALDPYKQQPFLHSLTLLWALLSLNNICALELILTPDLKAIL